MNKISKKDNNKIKKRKMKIMINRNKIKNRKNSRINKTVKKLRKIKINNYNK